MWLEDAEGHCQNIATNVRPERFSIGRTRRAKPPFTEMRELMVGPAEVCDKRTSARFDTAKHEITSEVVDYCKVDKVKKACKIASETGTFCSHCKDYLRRFRPTAAVCGQWLSDRICARWSPARRPSVPVSTRAVECHTAVPSIFVESTTICGGR